MSEILSCEQPCVLCGQALQVVVLHEDALTGEQRIERTNLTHDHDDCLRMLRLYGETLPRNPEF